MCQSGMYEMSILTSSRTKRPSCFLKAKMAVVTVNRGSVFGLPPAWRPA